jgi:hypothetical protein
MDNYEKFIMDLVSLSIKIVNVVKILWKMVTSWIKDRIIQIRSDASNLVFSLKGFIDNEKHQVIHGLFNERTGEMDVDTEDLRSNEIDDETQEAHRDNKLVIFDT